MVDNQHRKITGYRDLTEEEIALLNEVKAAEASVAQLQAAVAKLVAARANSGNPGDNLYHDAPRQAAIAKTEFEGAFMRLARAVANPATPWR